MDCTTRAPVDTWHAGVNSGDPAEAARTVGDACVVTGPKGVGTITAEAFAGWVERSGIRLVPRSWHPISDQLIVVEQDATWPASEAPVRVATVFRVVDDRITACLRRPDLESALELAQICRAMAGGG